jgi:transposase InsO family protein
VNVYPFIEAEKRCRRNVKRACELLKVSRAAFYQYLAGPSRRGQDDAQLASEIQAVHQESRGRYGAPRVHAELRRRGRRHGRKRVARLMRQAGIAGLAARRWKTGSAGTLLPTPASSTRAGAATSLTSAPGKGGCSWPPSSTSPPAASWAMRWLTTCAPA